jgi:hypothetical protein
VRIFDRDLKLAGIAKRDERGRTLDVHALRTTFGTLLSRAGVPLRTAQSAMRHSDPKLTANVYTDPKLLDVVGAIQSLPSFSLDPEPVESTERARATGTYDLRAVALHVALTGDIRSETACNDGKTNSIRALSTVSDASAASADSVNEKGPLTIAVRGPSQSGRQDGY